MEAKQRFEQASLPTRSEESVTCCYAVQDRVWIEDPDGNSWEVFVVKADAPTMTGADRQGCCAGGGCGTESTARAS
jgi:hypothetical protein